VPAAAVLPGLRGGLLKVGPQSAGAEPGPICYDRGGTLPTFTDAAVVLGYIDPDNFLGGQVKLDATAARAGLMKHVAEPLGLTDIEAGRGIYDVLLARTVSAIREITVQEGFDPREFSMLAYGGAGPMFVPLVAREMDVREVIVPQAPAGFSAWGMLMTDLVQEYSETCVGLLEHVGLDNLWGITQRLAHQANEDLERGGFAPAGRTIEYAAALRYFAQEHTLDTPLEEGDDLANLCRRFDAVHKQRYGHTMTDPVQIVHVRVRGIGHTPRPELRTIPPRVTGTPAPRASRKAYCFAHRAMVNFAVYDRDELREGDIVPGPAIVEEATTTLVFFSDQSASVDKYGHLFITETKPQ
jgi:N-methylhydantoinase A